MTDPIPSDEQLDRIARRVRERIDARSRSLRQAATALVVVALVAGGIGLLAPALRSTGSGASGGSGAGSSAEQSGGVLSARCHTTPAASSRSVAAALPRGASAADARTACLEALSRAATSRSASPSAAPRRLVVCRSGGLLEVYPADGDPAGLCARNGLTPVVGGVVPVPVGTPAR